MAPPTDHHERPDADPGGKGGLEHQLRNSSATYGQFGTVIGLVAFLFLLAEISLYGVELNPVLHRQLVAGAASRQSHRGRRSGAPCHR
jgi:hypothetical protein